MQFVLNVASGSVAPGRKRLDWPGTPRTAKSSEGWRSRVVIFEYHRRDLLRATGGEVEQLPWDYRLV